MFGFKAVNHDLSANNNFMYTIGETYNLPKDIKPKLCKQGFHFCKIPLYVFQYYNNSDDRYLLVEATGTIDSDHIKCCTNQLKIIKEINRETFLSELFNLEFFKNHYNLITNDNKLLLFEWTCKKGHLKMMKYFIEEHNCDPHVDFDLPLKFAAEYGHLKIVKYLIETHNCDPHVNKECFLRLAAEKGHLEIVKYLIERCMCDPHVSDIWGSKEAVLQSAVIYGHLEVVQYLIGVCKCDPHSEKALRWAAEYGHLKIVKYLIGVCNCDPHLNEEEPFGWAVKNGHNEIIKYLSGVCNCKLKNMVFYSDKHCEWSIQFINKLKTIPELVNTFDLIEIQNTKIPNYITRVPTVITKDKIMTDKYAFEWLNNYL